MGTGAVGSLFTLLGLMWGTPQYSPYFRAFIRWPALLFLILDIAIFSELHSLSGHGRLILTQFLVSFAAVVFSAAFTARYCMFPQVLPLTIKHAQKSMFLGTIPMGLITITSNICYIGTTSFDLGLWPTFVAVGLWFFCVILSTVVAIGVPWSIVTYQKEHRFEATTAALLLPVVPPITAAATGSVIVEALMQTHPTLAFVIWNVSMMQLGIGLPLALMVRETLTRVQQTALCSSPLFADIGSLFATSHPFQSSTKRGHCFVRTV